MSASPIPESAAVYLRDQAVEQFAQRVNNVADLISVIAGLRVRVAELEAENAAIKPPKDEPETTAILSAEPNFAAAAG